MVMTDKTTFLDALADKLSRIQIVAVKKPTLSTLPAEILAKILWYLITDTSHGANPNILPFQGFPQGHTCKYYYHTIYFVTFEPLMYVNKFFFELVHESISETISPTILMYTQLDNLSVNEEKFVFCQNKMQELFKIKPERYVLYPLKPHVLSHVKTLYLVGHTLKLDTLVGFNWLDGICETTVTYLSKLVIDMSIFEDLFATQTEGSPSTYSLVQEEASNLFRKQPELIYEKLSWALVEKLNNQPSKYWTQDLAQYKIQFLFNALAKLVANKNQPVDCSIINYGYNLFRLAQFL